LQLVFPDDCSYQSDTQNTPVIDIFSVRSGIYVYYLV